MSISLQRDSRKKPGNASTSYGDLHHQSNATMETEDTLWTLTLTSSASTRDRRQLIVGDQLFII